MNFIGFVILSIIFGLNIINADKHSRIYQQSDHRSHIRRNVISDGVLSSGLIAVQPVSTSLDKVATKLLRNIRLEKRATTISISCQTNANCTQLGPSYVCVPVAVLSVGICVSQPVHNTATSMIYSKNIFYVLIFSGLILIFN